MIFFAQLSPMKKLKGHRKSRIALWPDMLLLCVFCVCVCGGGWGGGTGLCPSLMPFSLMICRIPILMASPSPPPLGRLVIATLARKRFSALEADLACRIISFAVFVIQLICDKQKRSPSISVS